MPDDPIREQVETTFWEIYTSNIRDQRQSDDVAVRRALDAALAVATPLLRIEPSHLIEHIRAIEDDTDGWHITVENHAGMSIAVYGETWKAAMDLANAQAFEWFGAHPGGLEPIDAGEVTS
jgi:hypothetical protein